MSVAGAIPDRAVGGSAAHLLANWWSRPQMRELERWSASWAQAYEVEQALGLDPNRIRELQVAVETAQPEALLEEYERLLVGPGRAPCPPYESLWRDDQPRREQGRLMGAASAEIARIYRDLDLQVRADAHELPDHIAVEWEALAYAFEQGAVVASADLAGAHLAAWMGPFCSAVAAETSQQYYATLAGLTPEWTAALTA